jgi:hypothetical protein
MADAMNKHNYFQVGVYAGGIAFVFAAALFLWMLLTAWSTLIARY